MSKVSPQRFGKYMLLRRIALGGMAEIFLARTAGAGDFEKNLVIKRILPHFSDDESFVKMFVDEARITARLQHPNIVQVFDFDIEDGSYYIAMEYIEGKDLKDVIDESIAQRDPLSVAQCVWLANEVAKGLHYAHTKEDNGQPLNIVHRDVTPSNVMVSYRGDVKLMDFGIAKAAQRSTKTQAGAVKGKVAYMSPEQARGRPIDGRSDVFALGVILWEMLTERRLFLAESDFETLNQVLKMTPPPPSSVNRAVPRELDAIVAKALTKDPEDRWRSAQAMGQELTRWYYRNVADLEKERLEPLMYRLFKREIAQLAGNGGVPVARAGVGFNAEVTASRKSFNAEVTASRAGQHAEVTASRSDLNAEVTAVRQAAADPATPASEQATRVHAVASGRRGSRTATVERPILGKTPRAAATTLVGADGGRRRSWWPWIVLAILLVGGGVAAVLLLTREPGAPPPEGATATSEAAEDASSAPAGEKATLYLKVDPHVAVVKVDGKVVDGEASGLEVGQKVRIVAEAPGYKRFEEIVGIDGTAPVYPIKMEREGVPQRVVIKPSSDTDEVFVNDQRLGIGAQPFEGVLGQAIVIKVIPASGGAAVTKVVELDAATTTVNVATPGELLISVEPADATLTASAGTIEVRSPGLIAVKDLEIGASVAIEAKAKGRETLKREVSITQALQTLQLVLAEGAAPGQDSVTPPTPPGKDVTPRSGRGSIHVAARPWAQVSLDGRPFGTTPMSIKDLPAGRYTIVLTKGNQRATRTVSVAAGRQAQVFVDFTNL